MSITILTLLLATRSMQSEIAKFEILTNDASLADEDLDEHGQYVLDLTQALGESGSLYNEARHEFPHYPSFDEMMARK